MNESDPIPKTENGNQKAVAPWWGPYLFTVFVLMGIVVFFMLCGWIGRIPLMEHILLGLMTLAALFDFFRAKGELPAVAGKIGSTLFFGLVGAMYLTDGQWIPGVAYGVMAGVWFVLFVLSVIERRKIRKETLEKLDRAIESLRDSNSTDESGR